MRNNLLSASKGKYIHHIQKSVLNILNDDYYFRNYKNQVFVKKIGVAFKNTLKEEYLWQRALNLSSNACFLIKESNDKDLAFRALKESAEIYEYLSATTEVYDNDYLLILSAFCYDIAGYQANALCLVRDLIHKSEIYTILDDQNDVRIKSENYILFHFQQILLKRIPFAKSQLRSSDDVGVKYFNESILQLYDNILFGIENDYLISIEKTYNYYIDVSNVYISHLLYLFQSRIIIYDDRSIWHNLFGKKRVPIDSVWKKYLRLLTNDFYDDNQIKKIDSRTSKFEFWISQLRAVEKGIVGTDDSFIIQMPTSAGKTFIAELAIMDCLVKYPGKRCIYIAPFRALTNEKEVELATNLSKIGYSVSAISGDYESDDGQDYILNNTDVLIATPEKIDLLFRMNQDVFRSIGLVIIDEGHIIGNNDERSSLIEFLVIRLRMKIPLLRVIFISAVMPQKNAIQFSSWLNKTNDSVIKSTLNNNTSEIWEPTRKLIASFRWTSNSSLIEYINVNNQEEISKKNVPAFIHGFLKVESFGKKIFPRQAHLLSDTAVSIAYKLSDQGNCLIFCSQPNFVKSVGGSFIYYLDILTKHGNPFTWFKEKKNTESYHYALEWFGEESYITKCISRGIGIHFGDLPEAIRRSVEKDYQRGNLRVLISTNTIGQGLNFPIKNLIIHSLIINPLENLKISIRDFWNIVGRAGRAGKETEGQVIFLTLSSSAIQNFHIYTNKNNIEQANSPFIKILNEYLANRGGPTLYSAIQENPFDNKMQLFSESYLLDMLIEETVESDDSKIIEQIIDNSLFKVQAIDARLDILPLRIGFKKVAKNIKVKVKDKELLEVFGKTGFCLKSNLLVDEYIKKHLTEINNYVANDNYEKLLSKILALFDNSEIKEITIAKLIAIESVALKSEKLIKGWISGLEISNIREIWTQNNLDSNKFLVFFSEGLFYRYPWGITSFLCILSYRLGITVNDLPDRIRNLAGFLKYGLNEPSACTARRLGIKNRQTSLVVAKISGGRLGEDFIKWLSNINIEDLQKLDLNKFDIENVLEVAVKINPKRKNDDISTLFVFNIKGIGYSKERLKILQNLTINGRLSYERDILNQFDPFAIKLLYNKKELGYIPREFAKIISTEIDLNDKKYKIRITDIIFALNIVEVKMIEEKAQ